LRENVRAHLRVLVKRILRKYGYPPDTAVERLLGDLYLNVGLSREAETHYLSSLTLAVNEKDDEGQMLDHLALARIYDEALGNKKSAAQHIKEAITLAVMFGDDRVASEAKRRLDELNGAGT
jgi:hypothetical protein